MIDSTGYVASLNVNPAEELRLTRLNAKAVREARFDLRQGTAITPRDADDLARAEPAKAAYWKFYGSELRRQRGKQ